ncbi:hypothetical protein OAS19_04260 [Altererythrobacter sp.]|nr:hypothetical protein [Altererythrobacter sp.]
MHRFFVVGVIVMLGGCSTLQGRPSPVVDMTKLANYTQDNYAPYIVLPTYSSQFCQGMTGQADGSKFKIRNGLANNALKEVPNRCIRSNAEKRSYRDEVLFTYISAVDARYRNFIMAISSQKKYGGALASTLGLYTSALASVASGDLATGFAASSTFMQGARGQLDKDLFYEQTLPALINLMEADRSRVRTSILEKLKADTGSTAITYGMAEAMSDISRYEDAASIEKAVASLVRQAAKEALDAETEEVTANEARIEAQEK